MRWLRDACTDGVGHRVVVSQRWRLRALRRPHVLGLIWTACSHGSVSNALPSLIGRVVQESADIVHEKRVEHLSNLLLVREVQRAIKRNPVQGQSKQSKQI